LQGFGKRDKKTIKRKPSGRTKTGVLVLDFSADVSYPNLQE